MCCRRVQTMPPARPTLVLTTLQMVLLSGAELNQECLAKDFLNCGQYKMGGGGSIILYFFKTYSNSAVMKALEVS